MSWESIGSVSTGQMPHDRAWILFGLGLAKKYLKFVCGDPPPECELEIMWHEHDLGSYPSLGIWSECDEPWDYIASCERALTAFDEAVSWDSLREHYQEQALQRADREQDSDDYDGDEQNADDSEVDEDLETDDAKADLEPDPKAVASDGLTEFLQDAMPRMGIGMPFDDEIYAQARPLFMAAAKDFMAAGSDLKQAMGAIIDMFLDRFGPETVANMKPYITQFARDIRDGKFAYDATGVNDDSAT